MAAPPSPSCMHSSGPASPVSTRGRTILALADLVASDGNEQVSVERLLERARVTRGDFERDFGDLDGCFLAAFDAGADYALRRAAAAAAEAEAEARLDAASTARLDSKFESALQAVLECMASAPALARLCLVDVLLLGVPALERRDRMMRDFVALLDSHLDGDSSPPLVFEMIVGGTHDLLERRVRAGDIEGLPEPHPSWPASGCRCCARQTPPTADLGAGRPVRTRRVHEPGPTGAACPRSPVR